MCYDQNHLQSVCPLKTQHCIKCGNDENHRDCSRSDGCSCCLRKERTNQNSPARTNNRFFNPTCEVRKAEIAKTENALFLKYENI